MPAMHYRIRWPDLNESLCYSPSLVIQDYFTPGAEYTVPDFLRRIREATQIASERVRVKFGMPCSRALAQLQTIELAAAGFADRADARIVMMSFHEGG